MKPIWREIVMAVLMGMVLPGIVLNFAVEVRRKDPEVTVAHLESTAPTEGSNMTMLLRLEDGSLEPMNMDAYLVRVVLAEMPWQFETEALKAQSVVARTFTLKAYTMGGKHSDSSVCTDPSCCQAYITEEEYLREGGTQEAIDKIRGAVQATSGSVLLYDGELIEATYFSCSGGSTEDAVAVWGTDFPYLRATASPGEEKAAHYSDKVYFEGPDFAGKLGLELSGSPENWLGAITYTSGGGVASMYIGGTEFKGTELRTLLGLRSTAFTMKGDDHGITVVTKGFGHRVGMSQYGADAMAVSGSRYEEILAHYYQGTILAKWEN